MSPLLGGGLIYKLLLGAKNATKTAKKFFSLPGVYAPPTPGASSPLLLYLERTHRPACSPTSLGSPIAAVRNAFTNFFSHFATALPIARARKRSSFRRYRAGIRKGNRGKSNRTRIHIFRKCSCVSNSPRQVLYQNFLWSPRPLRARFRFCTVEALCRDALFHSTPPLLFFVPHARGALWKECSRPAVMQKVRGRHDPYLNPL